MSFWKALICPFAHLHISRLTACLFCANLSDGNTQHDNKEGVYADKRTGLRKISY